MVVEVLKITYAFIVLQSMLTLLSALQPKPRAVATTAVAFPEHFNSIKLRNSRTYEITAIENTLRVRDITQKILDVLAVDATTGDTHFFTNVSVDNRNVNSFLYQLPPAYRLVNGLTKPYQVADFCFRNDGIVAFRLGDPYLDGQETVDVIGFDFSGKILRSRAPQPQVLTTPPSTPWQPDVVGSVILYIVTALSPPSGQIASISIDISKNSSEWVNTVSEASSSYSVRTVVVYVPSGWYVRWTLTNASIQRIVVFYV